MTAQLLTEYFEGDRMVYNLGKTYNTCIVQCAPNRHRLFFIGGAEYNSNQRSALVLEANMDRSSPDFNVVTERQPLP